MTDKLKIVIPLYPDVTHLDFTGPHQVLSRAPGAEVVVASMGGADVSCEGLVFTGLADLAKRVVAGELDAYAAADELQPGLAEPG